MGIGPVYGFFMIKNKINKLREWYYRKAVIKLHHILTTKHEYTKLQKPRRMHPDAWMSQRERYLTLKKLLYKKLSEDNER